MKNSSELLYYPCRMCADLIQEGRLCDPCESEHRKEQVTCAIIGIAAVVVTVTLIAVLGKG